MRRYETESDVRWYLLERLNVAIQLVKHKCVDSNQWFHNHDRSYIDIVLRGGYTESRRTKGLKTSVEVRRFNKRKAEDEHLISHLSKEPTWVLKFQGKKHPRHASWKSTKST